MLANGTNNIALTNGLVAGTSIGYFAVAGSTGNDTVDATGVNNGTAVAFYGTTGGNDTFKGGNGNDSFLFAAGTLTLADTVTGGLGNDTLWMTTAGTGNTADLAGVTGIEGVFQQSGGTFHFANGIATALAAVGSSAVDTFDGSAVTGYALTITGNGGADVLSGGSKNDKFMIADSAFASIDGNGGTDFVVLTQANQTLNVTGTTTISDVEVFDLTQAATATLTLTSADVSQITGGGNNLYVVADANDTVNIGTDWTFIDNSNTNAAIPGHNFAELHSGTAVLFVDEATPMAPIITSNGGGATAAISVNENTTAVTTVTAVDPNPGATLTFTMLTGAGSPDAGLFTLTGGVLTFTSAPNFEAPADADTNNSYVVQVQVSDGVRTDIQTITVNLQNVNEAPTAAVPTDASVGTAFSHTDLSISGLSVADPDAADPGFANVTATISSSNGALTFTTAGLASFTNNGSHTVTLTGSLAAVNTALGTLTYNSDDGFTGTDTVNLSVNDNGNISLGGALSSATSSFHIGVVPQVFIIDNTGGGTGGTGIAANPFRTINDFNTNAADGSGDYIYIRHGSGTYSEADGINLLGQRLHLNDGENIGLFSNPNLPFGCADCPLALA